MSDRYFVESPIAGGHAVLVEAEAHHLLHVMRAKVGARVTLFDNSGCEFDAVVEQTGRSEVKLAICSRDKIDREAPVEVTLAVALPKGDRQKWLIEKSVELGVTRLVPLETQRGVSQPLENALARLRRAVIEASKQCGRNRLMEITEPLAWNVFVKKCTDVEYRLLAHPTNGVDDSRPITPPRSLQSVVAAVGPEGGFTEGEVSLAMAEQWQPIDLGPRILRVETAAVALAAWLIGFGL